MSAATLIPWENPLAQVLREPGGVRLAEALARAEENLDSIREECLASVDGEIAELERLCAQGGRTPADPLKARIYDLANEVLTVAGTFGFGQLGEAAFCLAELTDRLRWIGKWNQAAVEVHLAAFRLLRRPDPGTDRSDVIGGLKRLTDSVAAIAE